MLILPFLLGEGPPQSAGNNFMYTFGFSFMPVDGSEIWGTCNSCGCKKSHPATNAKNPWTINGWKMIRLPFLVSKEAYNCQLVSGSSFKTSPALGVSPGWVLPSTSCEIFFPPANCRSRWDSPWDLRICGSSGDDIFCFMSDSLLRLLWWKSSSWK